MTASRWVLTRLAISVWVGAGAMRADFPPGSASLANLKQFGLNAIAYGKRAELVDAGRQRPEF